MFIIYMFFLENVNEEVQGEEVPNNVMNIHDNGHPLLPPGKKKFINYFFNILIITVSLISILFHFLLFF